MELYFLLVLLILMATALGSGYPVAFALPGASILTILLAAGCGYLFAGDSTAYFSQGSATQWLSAGTTNLRGIYWEPERDTLIAIPLFIFMGIMLQRSKIAEDLLITMANLFGSVPGGLGISVVFVGALLAATTGIVGATVVAMGLISLPAMLRNNYSQSLATGTIAASGTLGQIIPPSIVLIILADQLASAADQASTIRKNLHKEATGELSMPTSFDVISTSAGEMFLGALLPGLVLVALYMIYILVYAALRPQNAPPVKYDGQFDREFWGKVFVSLVPPLLLIFLVLGSIMSGIATVNQAGAIGAAGALIMSGYRLTEGRKDSFYPAILAVFSMLLIGFVISNYDTNVKNIKDSTDAFGVTLALIGTAGLIISLVWSGWRAFKIDKTLEGVMMETAKATSLVFIILLGAAILTAAFRAFGGEHLVREFLEGLPGGFWTKFAIVMLVIFLLGFFLDFIEIAVVVVPIVAPILLADPQANVTAVWLGVMIGLNIQTSFLTPPFGFALFYLRGVAPKVVKTINMYKGVIPFICLQIAALFIVAYAPQLVNYLPNRVALTSENAPPPRNPKLAQCLTEFVASDFAVTKPMLLQTAATAQSLDLTVLPADLAEDAVEAFGSVEVAVAAFEEARAAEAVATEAAETYRGVHRSVRSIERDIRRIDVEIAHVEDDMKSAEAAALSRLEMQLAELNEERDTLAADIPEDWSAQYDAYAALQRDIVNADRTYQNAASDAYVPIAEMITVLESQEGFEGIEEAVMALPDQITTIAPAELVPMLEALEDQIDAVEGAGDIKSAVSGARRDLDRDEPRMDDAIEEIDEAVAEYVAQKEWRAGAAAVLPGLIDYRDTIAPTLGMREQERLTREQALYVAGCQASHRDVSLNF
ncbi:MAG: TRAP transporter large permease subunit [Pseudomonadota bacterium]